ncbi:hypothetical protein [Nocardia noduli]|uniref:hypothetical protein n=1 Tax=Nocardia noduli TaxID=2815722 RepID=UPI001C227298|nr:hypothetical protein [Nocardia noduli]
MRTPTRTRVEDVVDFFAKCPRCGYPATATRTVREFDSGTTEFELLASCGLPCGWQQKLEKPSARPPTDTPSTGRPGRPADWNPRPR